ncbi:MAG: DNA polymerase I [Chthonomonas sp.]|nr:DNA polymerase I [Chthonomonas sp.]
MARKRLLILDGYSLLYRSFYGVKFLSTSDGRPTNALFGLVSMLFNLIEKQHPHAILVALDAPGGTFRHVEYAEYKGTRREMPEEMQSQMPVARELLAALGIPQIELKGFEADDIIGTISRQAEENGYDTTIISGDLDSLQLVDSHVSVVTPKVGVTEVVIYDPEAVRARYGFEPPILPDYKALVGDTSDNIPGVPGVGEKTAGKLLADWGSVEGIIENLDSIEEKFRKKLVPGLEQMPKSKWLATIDRNAPISWDFAPFRLSQPQAEAALAMLESLEFKNHHRRFRQIFSMYLDGFDASAPAVELGTESLSPKEVNSPRDVAAAREWIGNSPFGLLCTQAFAQSDLFGDDQQAWAIAVGDEATTVAPAIALALLQQIPGQAIMHDAKPQYRARQIAGLIKTDTLLAGYVLQSGRSQYALRDLAQGYLDVAAPVTPAQMALALVKLDAEMTAKLDKEGQLSVLTEIEQPLTSVLAVVENNGIKVSAEFLQDFSKSLTVNIDQLTKLIYEMAETEFLIASPKQLGEVLFEKMGIPAQKKTKTGYATGAEVLSVLAEQYPICQEVLNWRELTKLRSTYSESLPRMIAADGRIHTSFNQAVAATGRLSSENPNLQNIPIRTELGRQIRRAFVAEPGRELVSFDYSQIELRLLAHMCDDPNLVAAFQSGEDVHQTTAALMFKIDKQDVSKEQRRYAKVLNFAVLYGVTEWGLLQQLGTGFTLDDTKALIKEYNERFPAVKAFTQSVVEEARQKGFSTTLCGRRRYFPEIHAANRNERMYAERQAMNAPIQGSAADMIKIAMLRVAPLLEGKESRMVLQVHDELVFEVAPHEKDSLLEPIREAIASAMPLKVPVVADGKVGLNWGEMREF